MAFGERRGEVMNTIIETVGKYRKIIIGLLIVIITVAVSIPLYRQAIMCNDELLTRYWSGLGFESFYNHYYDEWKDQGRILAAPISSITMYLGFISIDGHLFRIEQIVVLIMCASAFGYCIKVIFKDNKFALLCAVSSLVFIPISFENTLPNAFISLIGIPTFLVLLSIGLFVRYLDKGGQIVLLLSMLLLFVSEMIYEAFVTIVPIYCLLAIYRNVTNKNRIIKNTHWPIITGITFLIVYFIVGKLFPSDYVGNTFANPLDIFNSIKIITTLFIDSLPGFYILNSKYSYILSTMSVKQSITFTVRVVILIAAYVILLIALFNKKSECQKETRWRKYIVPITTGLIVSILPYIPLSVSELYQDTVGVNFLAVPATYIASFGIVFTICFIIWSIYKDSNNIYPKICAIILVVAIFGPVQIANDIYSEEQSLDYDRLTYFEDFVKSDVLLELGCDSYSSSALYKTCHSMGFNDGYWTMYSNSYGNGIAFNNNHASVSDNRIYIDSDRIFEVWHSGSLTLISKYEMPSELNIYVTEEEMMVVDITNVVVSDSGWFVANCV